MPAVIWLRRYANLTVATGRGGVRDYFCITNGEPTSPTSITAVLTDAWSCLTCCPEGLAVCLVKGFAVSDQGRSAFIATVIAISNLRPLRSFCNTNVSFLNSVIYLTATGHHANDH